MNYYPFHIGDFRSGTSNMSRPTRWIYRDMLDVYYDKEQPLPLNHEKLFDELGVEVDDERRIVERLLRFKFIKTEEGYRHEICDRVIAEYHKKAETARTNGGKGGRPRNPRPPQDDPKGNPGEPKNNPPGFDPVPTSPPAETGLKTNQEPRTNNQSKPKPSSPADADGGGEGPPEEPPEPPPAKVKPFDQFWAVYPKRVKKLEAQKAWTALKLDGKVAEIVAAVEAQLEGHAFKNEGGRYIPHPASWLRAGCWLDEVQPWIPPPPKLPAGWWETREGLAKAGAMLTPPLTPRPGEYPKDFAQRIREALGQVDAAPAQASAAPPAAVPYVPPAPPAGVELTPEQRQARRDQLRDAMAKMKQTGNLAAAGIKEAAEQT